MSGSVCSGEKRTHRFKQINGTSGSCKDRQYLLEGGGSLNWSALESGIVQKVQTYIAPKLFGGEEAKTPVEGKGFPDPASAVLLKNSEITRLGDDLLIESEVK